MKEKPLFWLGSSRRDLQRFPSEVRREMGFALYRAQLGGRHVNAKPLSGFHGAGVLEVVEDLRGNTYRAVYTVELGEVVYVIHAFQKKSTRGRRTSKRDIDLIRRRLKDAKEHYESWLRNG